MRLPAPALTCASSTRSAICTKPPGAPSFVQADTSFACAHKCAVQTKRVAIIRHYARCEVKSVKSCYWGMHACPYGYMLPTCTMSFVHTVVKAGLLSSLLLLPIHGHQQP